MNIKMTGYASGMITAPGGERMEVHGKENLRTVRGRGRLPPGL